jgi:hypothetical protein
VTLRIVTARNAFTVGRGTFRYAAAPMNATSPIESLPGAMQSASTTINRGAEALGHDAAVVASSSIDDSGDMLAALVDSRQQLLYTQAGAKLMTTASEMLGTLIDIRA